VAKQAAVDATLQQIHDYGSASNAAGGFDRADAHLTRTALKIDRKGWERISASLLDVLRTVAEVEQDVRDREAAGEAVEREDVGLVLMLFQALPFSSPRPEGHTDAHF
jgi:hypothetical protein